MVEYSSDVAWAVHLRALEYEDELEHDRYSELQRFRKVRSMTMKMISPETISYMCNQHCMDFFLTAIVATYDETEDGPEAIVDMWILLKQIYNSLFWVNNWQRVHLLLECLAEYNWVIRVFLAAI
jgi:hypothetical protein